MNGILKAAAAVLALFVISKMLTAILPVKIALFKKIIGMTEKKYAAYEKCGERKKAYALKLLRWLLIQTDDITSLMIDAIVSVANERGTDMQASLKAMTTQEIKARMSALQKPSGGSGEDGGPS